jgi:predicted flap endonuclease-1-like 5' DNA nuclease
VVGERTETALRVPVGVASPLWVMFGAAASVGVAYWWMTRWTRAVNVEALASFAPAAISTPPPVVGAAPVEIIAEPAPVEAAVEAIADAEPAVASVEATTEIAEAIADAEPVVASVEATAQIAEAIADDLTVMSGIGPKLSAALAERGVTRFAQIAAWTAADLADVDAALSLKGRAVREAWVAQAKRLADPK